MENLFRELALRPELVSQLETLGYTQPTPIQSKAIGPVLARQDVLACAQTGTGKTAAFALPILQLLSQNAPQQRRVIRALVLAPTRELALQISQSFAAYGKRLPLRTAAVFGGVAIGPQFSLLRNGLDVLVATPGRLLDLLNQNALSLRDVQVLVLDEADRMLDMGFLPDVRRIISKLPSVRQNLLFSATMPGEIKHLADQILRKPVVVAAAAVATTAERIDQSVYFVEKENKKTLLAHLLSDATIRRAIVFTRTKRDANRVALFLAKHRIQAEAIHGEKSQGARQRALDHFRRGLVRVLVATDIASRGIDVDDVTHVINLDVPDVPESYVHRIGRTARAGQSGKAFSFCSREERHNLTSIERLIRQRLKVIHDHPHRGALAA